MRIGEQHRSRRDRIDLDARGVFLRQRQCHVVQAGLRRTIDIKAWCRIFHVDIGNMNNIGRHAVDAVHAGVQPLVDEEGRQHVHMEELLVLQRRLREIGLGRGEARGVVYDGAHAGAEPLQSADEIEYAIAAVEIRLHGDDAAVHQGLDTLGHAAVMCNDGVAIFVQPPGHVQTHTPAGAGDQNHVLQETASIVTDNKPTIAAPDSTAQLHSRALLAQIIAGIDAEGGAISFADYMQLCLYQPGLGYYSAGSHKLGQGGDFTTAPELSPLFARALSRHVADVLRQCPNAYVLEFGAGSGRLAADLIDQLARDGCPPEQYFIIEPSADLRERQLRWLAETVPAFRDRLVWLDSMPARFQGAIIANEVVDAMPVHLLQFSRGHCQERCVSQHRGRLHWTLRPLSDPLLLQRAAPIQQLVGDSDYQTEVGLLAGQWLSTVAATLQQGAMFVIDYGYPFERYYHPERCRGTLMCYRHQRGHDDPLQLPGLQDITCHVEFSALAQTALDAGLDVAGFHEQADFLLAGDITSLASSLQQSLPPDLWLSHSAALKQLLLPGQMGHEFKVLTLSRGLAPLPRLQRHDRRYQL